MTPKRSDPTDKNGLAIQLLDERTERLTQLIVGEIKRLEGCIESVEEAIKVAKEVADLKMLELNHLRRAYEQDRGEFAKREIYERDMKVVNDALAESRGERRVVMALLTLVGAMGGTGVAAAIKLFT